MTLYHKYVNILSDNFDHVDQFALQKQTTERTKNMDLTKSDACDGRANQLGIFLIICGMLVGGFLFFKILIAVVTFVAFGYPLYGAITDSIIVMLLGIVLAFTHPHFWVKVDGNQAQPAINILFPKYLRDGGTRYIVFLSGISLKLPWVLLEGKPIEIERQKVINCKPFTVTVGDTSLEIEMKIAKKPHPHFFSSYLQNATREGGEQEIEGQFTAKAKQLVEVWCSKMGKEAPDENDQANYVRRNQSHLLRRPLNRRQDVDTDVECLFTELYKFGEWIGFELIDVSFSKCDFDPEVQKRMNQIKESEKILEITQRIMADARPGDGMTRDKASEIAAVYCGKEGVKISRQIIEGLDLGALGGLGKEILKKIGGDK